jgi:membrane-associated phospholipid phosphatase
VSRASVPGVRSPSAVVRCPRDALIVAVGAVLLVLSALPVSRSRVSWFEVDVFRLINDRTVLPFAVVWVVMQLGNMLVIPASALVAAGFRRFRLALGILVGGLATYYLAKVVKDIVVRGRPGSLLPDVELRGAGAVGRGYISGHAAVVTFIAVLAWPWLGRRMRIAVAIVIGVVCLTRVYVGAHLPLDVIGGAALGVAVAGVVRLLLGRPSPCS